ncbi:MULTISPECIES: hypothetical protein [Micromonospora]|uniref:Uncharacterized protein n=1 Tax=Micromonospora chalcea TaxID=1874 RepID=A0ABX9YCG2_MICCH|nr:MULTISPECIES: hypothetical protein [Micromonospora]MBP1784081.1 hypothetical protein [Micromonospora sp. HB375]MDH6467073.1 hypothetical protein [Micromonospora sp. H404/HB375]ODB78698.1 hypothetical protein A8711_01095 [Micromonospora sp. II]RQW97930.1 hypothetical protein DLJ60_02050 [Micromonospora chalcea]RQX43914.1 hypothetical protein DLJ57_14870 [Micromonospora chalcea]
MTTTTAPAGPTAGGRHGWRLVAALAVTSTIGYATLHLLLAAVTTACLLAAAAMRSVGSGQP